MNKAKIRPVARIYPGEGGVQKGAPEANFFFFNNAKFVFTF